MPEHGGRGEFSLALYRQKGENVNMQGFHLLAWKKEKNKVYNIPVDYA